MGSSTEKQIYWYIPSFFHNIILNQSKLLPLSLNVCRHDLYADNFDSIYRKYVQHFYLQINLLKN